MGFFADLLVEAGIETADVRVLVREIVVILIVIHLVRTFQRFAPFAHILLQKLLYFPPPATESLREFCPSQKQKGKKADPHEDFTIPRDSPVTLEHKELTTTAIDGLPMVSDLENLGVLAMLSIAGVIILEIRSLFGDSVVTFNSTFVVVTSSLFYALFALAKILKQYSVDELSACGIASFLLFIVAVGSLINDQVFDFGISQARDDINNQFPPVEAAQGGDEDEESQELGVVPNAKVIKFVLALLAGLSAFLLTYPTYRFTYCHVAALENAVELPWKRVLLHINFFWPLLIVLSFSPMLYNEVLGALDGSVEANVSVFLSVRAYVVLGYIVLQAALLRTYLQSFFFLALDKVAAIGKPEDPAAPKRVNASFVQNQVLAVVRYACVVAVQLSAPILLMFCSWFILKNRGEISWLGSAPGIASPAADDIPDAADKINAASWSFPPSFYRCIGSFLCWWVATVWVVMTASWMLYIRKVKHKIA